MASEAIERGLAGCPEPTGQASAPPAKFVGAAPIPTQPPAPPPAAKQPPPTPAAEKKPAVAEAMKQQRCGAGAPVGYRLRAIIRCRQCAPELALSLGSL